MRIGEVAAASGVTVETLRYYERRGLLAAPARLSSGYRQYTAGAVRIVRFIKDAQDLGFTLSDIQALLHLAEGGPDNCHEVRDLTQTKIEDVTAKIDKLTLIRGALEQLAGTCDMPRADRSCPLLAGFEPGFTQTQSQPVPRGGPVAAPRAAMGRARQRARPDARLTRMPFR